MKRNTNLFQLKLLILCAGVLGLALRILLYATGTDAKGLLVSGHFAQILIWILTSAIAGILFWQTKSLPAPQEYSDAFPVSISGAVGCFLAGIAIFICAVIELPRRGSALDLLAIVAGFLAGAAFLFIGYCRLSRLQPHMLLHGAICLFFALRMVCQYRSWSSDPQLQDYFFYLCAYVCLMLSAYQHAAFSVGLGSHRKLWGLSLGAVYLCCLSLKGSRDTWLLLACGVWAFTNLSSLSVRQRRQRPVLKLDDDPAEN